MAIVNILFFSGLIFCAAFAFFAYQAGFFRIVVGSEERVKKEPTVAQVKEMLSVLEKERQVWENRTKEKSIGGLENTALIGQMDVEKKALEAEKTELAKILDEIESSTAARSGEEDKQVALLAKVYSTMKPDDAVKVFEKMSDETVISILAKMKPQVSSGILGKMRPARVSIISEKLKAK